jgi:hypothetical protein
VVLEIQQNSYLSPMKLDIVVLVIYMLFVEKKGTHFFQRRIWWKPPHPLLQTEAAHP